MYLGRLGSHHLVKTIFQPAVDLSEMRLDILLTKWFNHYNVIKNTICQETNEKDIP